MYYIIEFFYTNPIIPTLFYLVHESNSFHGKQKHFYSI